MSTHSAHRGLLATWGPRPRTPRLFRFRLRGPGTAFAARRVPAALRESVTAPVTGATAAPPPRQLGSSVRAIFKLPLRRSRCLGERNQRGRQARGRCGRGRREPRPELRVSAAPGTVGPAGAAPSLPGRSPRLGPGTAGRAAARPREEVGPGGARRLRRLRFLRPFPSTPAREAAAGRSACWSCLIAPCPARHGRLCGPCRLASCFLMG